MCSWCYASCGAAPSPFSVLKDPDSLFPAKAPIRWANGEGPWADLKLGDAQPVAAAGLGPAAGGVSSG